jgi:hypothetical protein
MQTEPELQMSMTDRKDALPAKHSPELPEHFDAVHDALIDSGHRKALAGEPLSKEEANAHFAAGLFNPTNQVYFRAGLIACREYMARFVEAQSPEIAASIRANWWPDLGPDLGPPRRMAWSELVASGDERPVVMRDDISPTLEALPIALAFFQPEVQAELERLAAITNATQGEA